VPVDTIAQIIGTVFDPQRKDSLRDRMALPEIQTMAANLPKGTWKAVSLMIKRIAKGRING